MFRWFFKGSKHLKLDVARVSECGPVRRNNQDSFFVDPNGAVFCVADGMGGADGGEIASRMVCERIASAAQTHRGFGDLMKRAADAITNANREIHAYATARSWRQMGTTMAGLFLNPEGGREAVIAHIGDSRIYRLRAGKLDLLTHDHTVAGELSRRASAKGLVEELARRAGALSHVLTRAIGIDDVAIPDWRKIELNEGDTILICSDGVYDMAGEEDLRSALSEHQIASESVEDLARRIVKAGACDNYTAIVIKVGGLE